MKKRAGLGHQCDTYERVKTDDASIVHDVTRMFNMCYKSMIFYDGSYIRCYWLPLDGNCVVT